MILKNKFILLLLLIVINFKPIDVFTQIYSYGPHIGINTMKMYNNRIDNGLYGFGYDFGIYAERKMFKNFSLGLSLNFTQKKYASSDFQTSSFIETMDNFLQSFSSFLPVEISIKDILETLLGSSADLINDTVYTYYRDMTDMMYVELPFLLSYNYKKFTFCAGPDFSFISKAHAHTMLKQEIPLLDMLPSSLFDTMEYGAYINGTINSLFPAYKDTVYDIETTTNDYASFNVGFLAGVSYEVYDNLSLSIFYSHMFSNMYDNSKKQAYHNLVNVSLKYNLRSIFKTKPSFSN